MRTRKSLLVKLMQALVDEWGVDLVRETLERLNTSTRSRGESRDGAIDTHVRQNARQTALSVVEHLDVDDNRKRSLRVLASRFDNRDFLPSTADVREFIIMAGERPPSMKNRNDSFRSLLRVLLKFPTERLERVAEAAHHSGPAQLGPISDAITAAGDRLPRRNLDTKR